MMDREKELREEEGIAEEDMQDVEGYKMKYIEDLADAAEEAYDAGMDVDEILKFIEQHLGLKFGDY
jgi:hypothetical protein